MNKRKIVSMVYVPMPKEPGHVLVALDDGSLWMRPAVPGAWDDLTTQEDWYEVDLPRKENIDEK